MEDKAMEKKKHAPIEQLRKAGAEARKKLIERGIVTEENSVQRLMKDKPKMILPGIPSYIPHKWTIKASQRLVYDLLKIWQEEAKLSKKNVENLAFFIEFVVAELNKQEFLSKKKMKVMEKMIGRMKNVPVLGKIFEPINQFETTKAMNKFMVDSFAVAIMVNGQVSSTSEFAEWFLDWTNDIYSIRERKDVENKKN